MGSDTQTQHWFASLWEKTRISFRIRHGNSQFIDSPYDDGTWAISRAGSQIGRYRVFLNGAEYWHAADGEPDALAIRFYDTIPDALRGLLEAMADDNAKKWAALKDKETGVEKDGR